MTFEKSPISPNRDVKPDTTRRDDTDDLDRGDPYEIKVEGQLDAHWSKWLGGLSINYDSDGNTLLTGIIPDQSALHGVLGHIRDLGLRLIALRPVGKDE